MANEWSSLVVRIDKDLHRKIKAACAIDGTSIKDYIIKLLEKDMQERDSKNKS